MVLVQTFNNNNILKYFTVKLKTKHLRQNEYFLHF